MILKSIAVFLATTSFAVIFNVPKKELIFCGFVGLGGWLVFESSTYCFPTGVLPVFLSTVVITSLSRMLAFRRKQPISVYLISGIIPLVPGAGVYYTMYSILSDEGVQALIKGIETVKISGAIALGIMTVLSLPFWFFSWATMKKR